MDGQPENNSYFKEDVDLKYNQGMLVMGGWSAQNTYEFYDFYTECWSKNYFIQHELSRLDTRECKLAVVNGKVYVICRSGIFNFTSDGLINLIKDGEGYPEMEDSGVGVLNNCIYVVGGFRQGNTVKKFDVINQQWSVMNPMSTYRQWPGVGVLNGLLYAIGGQQGPRIALNSVEFYDPNENVWTTLNSSLITERSQAAVGILDNKMYVIGGYDGNGILSSVECFSLETNEFEEVAPLNIPRCSLAAVVFDGKLYAIGGRNQKYEAMNYIEVYCPKINKWELLKTNMNERRGWHGATIIENIDTF